MAIVTVKQVIESLQQFPEDAPFEVVIKQYNKVNGVAYLTPIVYSIFGGKQTIASMQNGHTVRMDVHLPSSETEFTYTAVKKIK